jgi:hypothetical protein
MPSCGVLRHPQPIVLRKGINLDNDLLDRSTRRLAAADRFHPDEARRLQLRQSAGEVRLSAPGDRNELGNRTGLAVPNECEQLPILGRQQSDQSLHRIEAWLGGIDGSSALAARDGPHLAFQRGQVLNRTPLHVVTSLDPAPERRPLKSPARLLAACAFFPGPK